MTHYTVLFNSAIPEQATISSLKQERFQGTLEDWRLLLTCQAQSNLLTTDHCCTILQTINNWNKLSFPVIIPLLALWWTLQ